MNTTPNADLGTPAERPKWAEAVRVFITDTVIMDDEYEYPENGSADWLHGLVGEAVNAIFCNAYGHDIIDDQCMIPAHRYCVYCNRRAADLSPNDGSEGTL